MHFAYAFPIIESPGRHGCRGAKKHHLHAMAPGGGHGPGGHHHGRWGGAPFAAGGPFGPRRRMRRGDVRAALLVLLDEEPRNGYGLMQEIERRSDGIWRPSPGSVYPALAQLEDEGLVHAEQDEGRKRFALSEAGRTYVEEHRAALGEPWAGLGDEAGAGRRDLRGLLGQLGTAAVQVAQAGDEKQVEQASRVLSDARRALYRLLAEDDASED